MGSDPLSAPANRPAVAPMAGVVQFQSLIVGTIGFAGVILTLMFNARQARMAHERQVAHEANSLRVALLAELKRLHERLIKLDGDTAEDGANRLFPNLYEAPVFAANLGKLGLLEPQQVEATIKAHDARIQLYPKIGLFGDFEQISPHLSYVRVAPTEFRLLKAMWVEHVEAIRAGVEALERRAAPQRKRPWLSGKSA